MTTRERRKPLSRNQAVELILSQDSKCRTCGERLQPGNIHYDHIVARELGGSDDLENMQAICIKPCHHVKTFGRGATTYGSDIHAIAKTRRLANPKPKKPSRIRSRGFPKNIRKRMNGQVERIEK